VLLAYNIGDGEVEDRLAAEDGGEDESASDFNSILCFDYVPASVALDKSGLEQELAQLDDRQGGATNGIIGQAEAEMPNIEDKVADAGLIGRRHQQIPLASIGQPQLQDMTEAPEYDYHESISTTQSPPELPILAERNAKGENLPPGVDEIELKELADVVQNNDELESRQAVTQAKEDLDRKKSTKKGHH